MPYAPGIRLNQYRPLGAGAGIAATGRDRARRRLLAIALPLDPGLLDDLDLLVANKAEAAMLGDDPAAIARRLRQAFVVTRGAAGSTAFLRDGRRLEIPVLATDAVDTTGAGDTFVGVLAA